MKLAFCGASGTGKSTLCSILQEKIELPKNPYGARSVAQNMGFKSPYDVDKMGKRAEFARELLDSKTEWERNHLAFLTDRSTLDDLAYTMLHDIYSIDEDLLRVAVKGFQQYTHVIYCSMEALFHHAGDPFRVENVTYHRLYDVTLQGLIRKYLSEGTKLLELNISSPDEREIWLDQNIVKDYTHSGSFFHLF